MHSTPKAPHTTSGRYGTVYGAFAKNKIDQVPGTAGNPLHTRIPYRREEIGNRHFFP